MLDPTVQQVLLHKGWRFAALSAGAILVTGVGLIDDIRSIRPSTKLVAEIALALAVAAAGYRITTIMNTELGWFGMLTTVLWIVSIVNAVNMVDGLDGLATGLGLMSSGTLFLLSLYLGRVDSALILAALCGALLGFLRCNFHPASMFLGDSGSLLIGFLLGVMAVDSTDKAATVVVILAPLLVLGLPMSELVLTMMRRLLRTIHVVRHDCDSQRYNFLFLGRPKLFTADRNHIHHRLIACGITHRLAVLTLYGFNLALCGLAFVLVGKFELNQALLLSASILATIGAVQRLGYRELSPFRRGLFLPVFNLSIVNARIAHVAFDLAATIGSYLGAYLISQGGTLTPLARAAFMRQMPLVAFAQIGSLVLTGFYQRSYRYAGIADLVAALKGLGLAVAASTIALVTVGSSLSPTLIILDGYILATMILGARLSFRLLDYIFNANRSDTRRVMIYGAGRGGMAALQETLISPGLNMSVVGFIDDDTRKWGRMLNGVRVFEPEYLLVLARQEAIDEIIVASAKISDKDIKRLVESPYFEHITIHRFQIRLEDVKGVSETDRRSPARTARPGSEATIQV
jgi:UDP-GlcNAc:undecaprenyl-phosphate GlcNAc-1-phosphate transferase